MQNKNKKTIGIRVPEHPVPKDLSRIINGPFLTASLILPGDLNPLTDADDVQEHLNNEVDLIINCHYCGYEPTTVVDLTQTPIEIIRQGAGEIES